MIHLICKATAQGGGRDGIGHPQLRLSSPPPRLKAAGGLRCFRDQKVTVLPPPHRPGPSEYSTGPDDTENQNRSTRITRIYGSP